MKYYLSRPICIKSWKSIPLTLVRFDHCREFGFILLSSCILLLPLILGPDGLWYAVPVSEVLGAILAATFLILLRKRYGY